jgi:hypothetical protein
VTYTCSTFPSERKPLLYSHSMNQTEEGEAFPPSSPLFFLFSFLYFFSFFRNLPPGAVRSPPPHTHAWMAIHWLPCAQSYHEPPSAALSTNVCGPRRPLRQYLVLDLPIEGPSPATSFFNKVGSNSRSPSFFFFVFLQE